MLEEKLVRVGQYMINIEKHTTMIEEDEFFPKYKEVRLRLTCPHKNYEVSLMKNHWRPDRANDENNYREVATIDKDDDDYIQDGYRWMIGDKTGKEVLRQCLAAYSMNDDINLFHDSFYDTEYKCDQAINQTNDINRPRNIIDIDQLLARGKDMLETDNVDVMYMESKDKFTVTVESAFLMPTGDGGTYWEREIDSFKSYTPREFSIRLDKMEDEA